MGGGKGPTVIFACLAQIKVTFMGKRRFEILFLYIKVRKNQR
jgi:hypothetical protein